MEASAKKPSAGFEALPAAVRLLAFLLAAMALYLVYDQFKWWTKREDYSFGFIVPFFVGFVVYERWPRIRSFLLEGQWTDRPVETVPASRSLLIRILVVFAWIGAFGGLFLFFLGGFLQAITANPLLPGGQALAFGFGATFLSLAFVSADSAPTPPGNRVSVRDRLLFTGLFVFPALIWILSIPLLTFAEIRVSLFLLDKVTIIVFHTFDILGIPLERRGNVLMLENGSVGVEDACSGIRSLTACLFAGSFLAAVFLNKWWKKVLLVACAMVFAFIMNIFRSLFLTFWAHLHGSESIAGKVHDMTGYAVLGFTCVGLLLLLPIFNFKLNVDGDEEADSGSLRDPKDSSKSDNE